MRNVVSELGEGEEIAFGVRSEGERGEEGMRVGEKLVGEIEGAI